MARGKFGEAVLNKLLNIFLGKPFPVLKKAPETGKWYALPIGSAKSSDGTAWEGYFKKGSVNKLVVCFFGGGVSIDNYSAARTHEAPGGFYNPRITQGQIVMANCEKSMGLTGKSKKNPFRDWSVIMVPYCNGDFHAGAGETHYKGLDQKTHTMYYHGFLNYRAILEEGMKYLPGETVELFITGGSAGGFGAAILADDIMEHFPRVQKAAVCVDSALLCYKDWRAVMETQWHSPGHICEPIHSENITLDALTSAKQKYGKRLTVLFDCSIRDAALAQTQVYFDRSVLPQEASRADGDRFQKLLKAMTEALRRQVPDCGIYIWEKEVTGDAQLTPHTITGVNLVFKPMDQGPSLADWIKDALAGNVRSYGLGLLDKQY